MFSTTVTDICEIENFEAQFDLEFDLDLIFQGHSEWIIHNVIITDSFQPKVGILNGYRDILSN